MARRVKLETKLGNVRRHTSQVAEELFARYEVFFAWGIGATGSHKEGRALDVMAYSRGGGVNRPGPIRKGWNKAVAEYIWANRKRLGVEYVIYDQLIISTNPSGYAYNRWTRYPGVSHANHVHTTFKMVPVAYKPPVVSKPKPQVPKEDELPTPKDVAEEVFNKPYIPNRDDPTKPASGKSTLAGVISNIEATQDQHNVQLRDMKAKLDSIESLLRELADKK